MHRIQRQVRQRRHLVRDQQRITEFEQRVLPGGQTVVEVIAEPVEFRQTLAPALR